VPIAMSPGRSGFGPQLSLSYDSGAGNSPFGFGWSLSLPSITRKTDKGLPKYQDTDESDVFILSGAEDLVPLLIGNGEKWEREVLPPRTVCGPPVQGLYRAHARAIAFNVTGPASKGCSPASSGGPTKPIPLTPSGGLSPRTTSPPGTARLSKAAFSILPIPPASSVGSSARAMTIRATSSHTATKRKTRTTSTQRRPMSETMCVRQIAT